MATGPEAAERIAAAIELPDDMMAQARLLRAAGDLAHEVMRFTERDTEGLEHDRLITGLALQRALAGFYARLAIDLEAPDIAADIAAEAVRTSVAATAELAASLVTEHLRGRS